MFRMLFVVLFALVAATVAAEDRVFVTEAGAIRGYDPVAYHRASRAVLGTADLTHDWNGATWHFTSAANRDAFAADPGRYAPQYGGYCAYGTSQGYKVSTDPEAFAVVDGELYLNYNRAVQATWDSDRAGYIGRADVNWATLEDAAYTSDADSTRRPE